MLEVFQTISPVDGSVYVERTADSHTQIDKKLALAKSAQRQWQKTSITHRADICRKMVQYFNDHSTDFSLQLTWQMGRPIRYTPFEIQKGFTERALYMIEKAEDALADIKVEEKEGFNRFIRKSPLGTVFVLAPWNYPYLTSVNSIVPAIMAGNAVLLKMAQQTPLCAEHYAAAFEWAGLPEGVFQYMHISHKQVSEVISDDRINYVAFTGSVSGGKAIQNAVNQRFITAGLELGGKDPAYIRADADINNAIENLVDGAFFNSGQSCCGVERIYVHNDLFEDFVDGFVNLSRQYVVGNPTDPNTTLGPMVRVNAAEFVLDQISDAVQKGANLHINKNDFPSLDLPYLAPQVLTRVNHDMRIMNEESFGPVVGIMSVKNDEEAIQLMNDSDYGLTASIWTNDIEKAINIGDQIETGTWFMNRCDYLDPALCWTGVKDSGKGCTLSSLGYDHLTRPKSFHLKV